MSQANVESARRVFEAFARGGPEAVVDFSDPEIELSLPPGMIQAGGTYRGREAVLGWMKEWAEAWEEVEYTPEEFTEADDTVVVGVLYEGRGKGSGVRTEGRFWYLFKYRHGRLVSARKRDRCGVVRASGRGLAKRNAIQRRRPRPAADW